MTDETVQEAVVIPGPETPIVFSVTDAAINQMKAELLSLTLPAQEDKEAYKHIVEARKMVKKTRLDVGKKHDELTEDAKSYVKRVKAEADRIVNQLKPIEHHLQELEDAYVAEKERIRKQKELEAQVRIENRVNRLRAAGMVWDGESERFHYLNECRIYWEDIKTLSDEQFEPLALDVENRYKAYLEAEAERKRLEEEKAARTDKRIKRLVALGLEFVPAHLSFDPNKAYWHLGEEFIDDDDIADLADDEFESIYQVFAGIRQEITRKEEEKKRLLEEEAARVKAENERLERIRKEQEEQQRKLAEQQAELDRQREEMRLERERMEAEKQPKEPADATPVLPDPEPTPVADDQPDEVLPFELVFSAPEQAQAVTGQQMTVQQALAEGYTKCGYAGTEWTTVFNIEDLNDEDFENGKFVLMDQQEQYLSIPDSLIKDSIMDHLADLEAQLGCDTNMADDALAGFKWSMFNKGIKAINEALQANPYYLSTSIQLIK